jgi:histidyl-tRNA synthetase
MNKPGLPQGMRDFGAETVRKRNYILNTIRGVFELYGFEPLETPAMENLETLTGKYGEEGDKLIFKVLNNGLNDPKNREKALVGFDKVLLGKSSPELTERALKYDLTIPFARYVAMNHGLLTFPYKRYQMQPVWRADRPQKGRYREFTQCDADIVGSSSLFNETDLALIYHYVFKKLGLNYSLQINNRKILAALAELAGVPLFDITVAIDKLDKIGKENVMTELSEKGLNGSQLEIIGDYLSIAGNNQEKLNALAALFPTGSAAYDGISEVRYLLKNLGEVNVTVDFTLARGLNYYTGTIFEVKGPEEVKMGSIGGGGRYDDLTGLFGVKDVPGVGISFGVDRIYDVMEELNLFPTQLETGTLALFFNMGKEESTFAYSLVKKLRESSVSCELFHEPLKIDKQFRYAEKKKIRFAVIIGTREIEEGQAVVKNLSSGNQENVLFENLANFIKP